MFISSDNSTFILDIGTETYKAGYSDREVPTEYSSYYNSPSPVQHSTIKDIDSYSKLVTSKIPKDTSYLLVSENTFEDEKMKDKILEDIMEGGKASSILFSKSAILESFSYGKSTSLVISLGGGSSQMVSVVDGYITCKRKEDWGCEDISKIFMRKGNATGDYDSFKMREYGRTKKEDFYQKYNPDLKSQFDHTHTNILKIIQQITEVINNNSPDKRSILLKNIIVTGGGSYISNIKSIIEEGIYEKYKTENISITCNPSTFHCFFGGAIMGNIGSFKSLHIGKLDYQEWGVEILKKKNQSWVLN